MLYNSPNKQDYLKIEFERTNKILKRKNKRTKNKEYIDNVLKYKLLADEWANQTQIDSLSPIFFYSVRNAIIGSNFAACLAG